MDRETHHIIETAIYAGNGNTSDPFLDAIGARLVKRHEVIDIIGDFLIRQFCEPNGSRRGEGLGSVSRGDTDPGHYKM